MVTKDEAFRQFMKENKPLYVWNDNITKAFNAGWQSSQQQSAGEIAELKATIEELRYMQGINTDFAISELKADNEKLEISLTSLREALEKLARLGNGELYGNSEGNVIAQQSLSATPEQSMKGE